MSAFGEGGKVRQATGVHCAQRQCWKESERPPVNHNIFFFF
jgi:hypothetical protein